MAANRLVVLDRDGVINEDSDSFVKSVDEWRPIPGSPEAIAELGRLGFTVVVATNQSGLARGLFKRPALHAMHSKMDAVVEAAGGRIADIYVCPHGPDDGCDCRKPKPGLFNQIARDYDQSLSGVPMIGDSLRDLQAAWAVGGRAILVRTGKGRKTEAGLNDEQRNRLTIVDSLADAAAIIGRDSCS